MVSRDVGPRISLGYPTVGESVLDVVNGRQKFDSGAMQRRTLGAKSLIR